MTAHSTAGVIEARLQGRLGDFRLDAELLAPAKGVTALVGPSGSGKTTLLRCLAGLTRLEGSVRFGDQVWQDGWRFTPPHRRPVGYVFQEGSLFPHLSVRGNLAFGLKRSHAKPRVTFDDAVRLLGLSPLLDRSTAKLSGGERQRAALGRALLVQPELLLLDEPVSSLDVEGKAEVLARLEAVFRTLDIPVIYVSHDLAEVARLASRVVAMKEGRIVEPPAQTGGSLSEEAARAALVKLTPEQVRALALSALKAGLGRPPSGESA
jgi:molybdate transport system ATP-binding protein